MKHEQINLASIPILIRDQSLSTPYRVRREGAQAVHFLDAATLPFEVGSEVNLVVDWERRFDHMTQHSGQHLITAVADKSLGAPTTSWNMGEEVVWSLLVAFLLRAVGDLAHQKG